MPDSSQSTIEWEEIRTKYFALIFPADSRAIAEMMYSSFGLSLDQQYALLKEIFETELILPINLRIYPTVEDYLKLNPKAPQIGIEDTHSHVGFREIALIYETISDNYAGWLVSSVSAIRFELGILFAEQVTDLKAPPGLLAGVGGYMLNPITHRDEFLSTIPPQFNLTRPANSLQEIWEDEASFTNPLLRLQALSIVAYLVDEFSWPEFLGLLQGLSGPDSFSEVVSSHYQIDFSVLQRNWTQYYPSFWTDRWQYNVLYNYDLTAYETALKQGAYSSLEKNLKELLPFLVKTGQFKQIETVSKLLENARKGQLAGSTALQARQVLIAGEYEEAIQLANSALEQFANLGDARRKDEIEAYRSRAEEILELRQQADSLSDRALLLSNPADAVTELSQLEARLTSLEDVEGSQKIEITLNQINEMQTRRQNLYYLFIVVIGLILVGLRIWLFYRRKPVEASL